MSNPRIEEVSDSDPEIDDPSEFLPNEIMRPADALVPVSSPSQNPTLAKPPPPTTSSFQRQPTESEIRSQRAELKPYTTLYPVYFSSSRTRHSGRRVSKKLAVQNPLAFNILKAVRIVVGSSLRVAFEPDKTHPKDWSNPGRVKVQLFDPDSHEALHPTIKNKQYLYNLVAQELQATPTKKEDPLELKLQGLPVPENFLEAGVAVPRGWEKKMGSVLPVHSAAVSGGGVSDNFMKDAMEEMKQMQASGQQAPAGMDLNAMSQMMQGMQGMGGFGGGGGGGGSGGAGKKKDKKKG